MRFAFWLAVMAGALCLSTAAALQTQQGNKVTIWAGCLLLADGDVVQAPHGYIVKSLNAFVQHDDALPSGDDRYWLCTQAEGPLALYAPRDPHEGEPGHDE